MAGSESPEQTPVTVADVAAAVGGSAYGDRMAPITAVTHDSRQARSGALFVAVKGLAMDGHRFVPDVMRRGAAGVISELDPPDDFAGAWLKVTDARSAMAKAAAVVYGYPARELDLIGITGTNGKTTTTYLCFALAEAADIKPAMLTTVEYRIGNESEPAVRTTPEAPDTNRFLRRAVDSGCRAAVMETSSQAIDLHRCDALDFAIGVFTNLTRDHLDYHHTMENYFDAKKKLFDGRLGIPPRSSVVNIDDDWGEKLVEELQAKGQRVVTYSQSKPADLTADDVGVSLIDGTSFLLRTPLGERKIQSPLVGRPHVYNMLAAAAAAVELGYDLHAIDDGLSRCTGAPGRFERVPHKGDFAVVVDYAHTDDALLNTLATARDLAAGRIITVFGCGGDRDRSKRAPMGTIAGTYSDVVIITSDNPRNEDPMKIISAIEQGVKETEAEYKIISDRRDAIFSAIASTRRNDLVIIAGKGHETYQMIGNDKFRFDDREVALEALAAIEDR